MWNNLVFKMGQPHKHFRRLTYEESERLINLIRENPLYDQTKKEYHDRVLINNLYTQIATKLNIEGFTGKKKLTCL